jgi:hypothetical protein
MVSWLDLNETTGVLSGTPTNDDVGDHTVNISLDDGNGAIVEWEFNITVNNTNDLPTITSTPLLEAEEFVQYNYQVVVADDDVGDVFQYSLDIKPDDMTIGSDTGLVNWTPVSAQAGPNQVMVNVTDGTAFVTQEFIINVTVYPPTANLLSPSNGSVIDVFIPTLEWTGADPNSLPVQFTLYFNKDETSVKGHNSSAMVIETTTAFNYTPSTALDPGAIYYWTVVPTDGGNIGTCLDGVWSFTVNESVGNEPPKISSTAPDNATVGMEYRYPVMVYDQNAGDNHTFQLGQAPEGMTIDADTGVITWTPAEDQVGDHTVVIRVADRFSWVEQTYVLNVTAPPVNYAPQVDQIPDQKVKAGKDFTYLVKANDRNPEDVLTYILLDAPRGMTMDSSGLIVWKPASNQVGKHDVKVQVNDGVNFVNRSFTVEVTKEGTMFEEIGLPLIILMIIVIIVVAIGVAYVGVSRKRERAAQAQATQAIAAEVQEMKARISEDREMVEDFTIEGVFLIYEDGRLVARSLTHSTQIDDHLFSSMLVAIQGFVKESFKAETGLDSFEFSGRHIVLKKGRFLFLVASLSGKEPPMLRDEMKVALEKIEGTYAGVVEDWDGDISKFSGAEVLMAPLFTLKDRVKVKKAKADVRVKSALEFYEGYVRLKVAVLNMLDTTITDTSLNLTYNSDALRFDRIEPDLPHEGTTVRLGAVKPGEKKTVAYFLDPLICQESTVDCTLTYLDYKGELKHADMKRRPVDIVCPIFYTPQTVNVAMLKRLNNDLDYNDSRIFKIGDTQTLKVVYNEAKQVVSKYSVKIIREFTEQVPYEAEAWYYGEVQETMEHMVIRVAARESMQYLEIFVASDNLATLTGLLSELGNQLRSALARHGITEKTVVLETSQDIKAAIEKTNLLLDKYAESELDPGETGQK